MKPIIKTSYYVLITIIMMVNCNVSAQDTIKVYDLSYSIELENVMPPQNTNTANSIFLAVIFKVTPLVDSMSVTIKIGTSINNDDVVNKTFSITESNGSYSMMCSTESCLFWDNSVRYDHPLSSADLVNAKWITVYATDKNGNSYNPTHMQIQ